MVSATEVAICLLQRSVQLRVPILAFFGTKWNLLASKPRSGIAAHSRVVFRGDH